MRKILIIMVVLVFSLVLSTIATADTNKPLRLGTDNKSDIVFVYPTMTESGLSKAQGIKVYKITYFVGFDRSMKDVLNCRSVTGQMYVTCSNPVYQDIWLKFVTLDGDVLDVAGKEEVKKISEGSFHELIWNYQCGKK